MKLGISLHPVTPNGDLGGVLNVSRECERLGYDAVYMSGHVLGEESGAAVLDPMVALAAIAGATETIAVASSVLLLPHYNPVLLANEAASLDLVSNGRFVLGVGVGWNEAEFDALGVPFAERGARGDEYLQAMRALWSDRSATFKGKFTSFENATLGTAPLTSGGPPIWVGGASDGALRRALRFADAWHGASPSPEEIAAIRGRLAQLGEEVDRDPSTLGLNGIYFVVPPGGNHNGFTNGWVLGGEQPTAESIVESIGLLGEQGLTELNLLLPLTPDTLMDGISWIAEEVMPKVSTAGA
jgi:probable F420-dependent oxidoreductase